MRKNSKIKIIFLVFGIIFSLSTIITLQAKTGAINSAGVDVKPAGEGKKINVTLHQSYLNATTIEFANLSDSNTFTAPCPPESTFNSSSVEIAINDIYAPNKTLIIQNNPFVNSYECSLTRYTSFNIITDCFLINCSLNIFYMYSPTANIYLLNSSWNSNTGKNEPNADNPNLLTTIAPSGSGAGWIDCDFSDIFLNNSETNNNTWFIAISRSSLGDNLEWRWTLDSTTNNNSYAYYFDYGWVHQAIDYCMTLGLSPITATPPPEDIGFTINNTAVINNVSNSGYWSTSNKEYTSPSGNLKFNLIANWWDVSCNITKVQINYTKTDLKANSTYTVLEKDLLQWNASINENIDCYDFRISNNNYIIFKVPADWSDIRAFNGSTEKPVDTSAPAKNGYREVIVLGAGNGKNWFLTARVDNRPLADLGDDDDDDDDDAEYGITDPSLFLMFLAVSASLGLGFVFFNIWQKFKRRK